MFRWIFIAFPNLISQIKNKLGLSISCQYIVNFHLSLPAKEKSSQGFILWFFFLLQVEFASLKTKAIE